MKFFVDTGDINEIRSLADTGLLDGVTTNPTLIMKSGKDFVPLIREICGVVKGPVSAEVASMDFETMLKEGQKLAKIADNVAVKVPLTENGLRVCKHLSDDGIMVNVTLCFTAVQALLAAKAGATFISPFIGRLEDIGEDGIGLIGDIRQIYDNYAFKTEILAASVRTAQHVLDVARLGADVATMPPSIIRELYKHQLTDKGITQFTEDWKKTGQSIL